ncbi:hypothetical protein FQN57_002089 [Myotisia sp. PD_48]|nr:hypothetical protein FQN57_002089 [Myotisia sp. PD_48]
MAQPGQKAQDQTITKSPESDPDPSPQSILQPDSYSSFSQSRWTPARKNNHTLLKASSSSSSSSPPPSLASPASPPGLTLLPRASHQLDQIVENLSTTSRLLSNLLDGEHIRASISAHVQQMDGDDQLSDLSGVNNLSKLEKCLKQSSQELKTMTDQISSLWNRCPTFRSHENENQAYGMIQSSATENIPTTTRMESPGCVGSNAARIPPNIYLPPASPLVSLTPDEARVMEISRSPSVESPSDPQTLYPGVVIKAG